MKCAVRFCSSDANGYVRLAVDLGGSTGYVDVELPLCAKDASDVTPTLPRSSFVTLNRRQISPDVTTPASP